MPKGRILAVDDQRYFRELLEGMLTEAGFEVQTASGAEEALEVLEHASFDVVLTDLVMPEMDGNELVHRIKLRDPEQEVVVVTGVVDVKTAVDAMKLGAAEYLLKPFDSDTLASTLEGVLQRRRLRIEHAKLLSENIEYMGERSLIERALALFSFLSVEPLTDRILDGLCVETGAQGAVAWVQGAVEDAARETAGLVLASARGLVRVEGEAEVVAPGDIPTEFSDPSVRSAILRWRDNEGTTRPALFLALRDEAGIIGLLRLTDKLGGDEFDAMDRSCAEKFTACAQTALCNARRFRELERHCLEDAVTGAYTFEYFQNAVRNEIEKSTRHRRCFSILRISVSLPDRLREPSNEAELRESLAEVVVQLSKLRRASDLLAGDGNGDFLILLPEADALGAAQLNQRARESLTGSQSLEAIAGAPRLQVHAGAVTYPPDGTQLESLLRVLEERIANERENVVDELGLEDKAFSECLQTLLARGAEEPPELAVTIAEFVLGEPIRRPESRSLLFVSPGEIFQRAVDSAQEKLNSDSIATEFYVWAHDHMLDAESEGLSGLTIPAPGPGELPSFLISFGEGPAYALICDDRANAERTQVFQTSDRSLVEYLAFRIRRDLGAERTKP
jgi:diguanylate cyclase (GGDEF)-like protein